jgi:hypothetical protein
MSISELYENTAGPLLDSVGPTPGLGKAERFCARRWNAHLLLAEVTASQCVNEPDQRRGSNRGARQRVVEPERSESYSILNRPHVIDNNNHDSFRTTIRLLDHA